MYEGPNESNISNYFPRKCNRNTNKILVANSYIFCNYDDILPQSLRHFQQTSATLSKTLYTNAVKFPDSIDLKNTMKISFKFVIICKMAYM
jgi:hypothetical protein